MEGDFFTGKNNDVLKNSSNSSSSSSSEKRKDLDVIVYGLVPGETPSFGGVSPPDFSPFVVNFETYLKMVNVAYKKEASSPQKSPNGKIPYASVKGKIQVDSMFTIEHLATFGINLDGNLDDSTKARSRIIQVINENSLYWSFLYDRFIMDSNWEITKSHMSKSLPLILRPFVPGYVRRRFKKQLVAMGYGRHTQEEIYAIGEKDLKALSALLGDQTYFLGDKPHIIDCTVFGTLWLLLESPHVGPLVDACKKLPNLIRFKDNIKATYWGDWDKVIQNNWDKNLK